MSSRRASPTPRRSPRFANQGDSETDIDASGGVRLRSTSPRIKGKRVVNKTEMWTLSKLKPLSLLILPATVMGVAYLSSGSLSMVDAFSRKELISYWRTRDMGTTALVRALWLVMAWWTSLLSLSIILPEEPKDAPLRGASHSSPHLSFWVVLVLSLHGVTILQNLHILGPDNAPMHLLAWVADFYTPLLAVSLLLCFLLALALYLLSFRLDAKSHLLSTSGSWVTDFIEGRERRPQITIRGMTIDAVIVRRMGLLGWLFQCVCVGAKHMVMWGRVSDALTCLILIQAVYIWHNLYSEANDLKSYETSYALGFEQLFCSLVWQPFVCSTFARMMLHTDPRVSLPLHEDAGLIAALVMSLVGLMLHIHARTTLHLCNGAPREGLSTIKAPDGKRWPTSGLFAHARGMDITGKWLTYLGFASFVLHHSHPLFILHMTWISLHLSFLAYKREHEMKHGFRHEWSKLKHAVPFRLFPKIF